MEDEDDGLDDSVLAGEGPIDNRVVRSILSLTRVARKTRQLDPYEESKISDIPTLGLAAVSLLSEVQAARNECNAAIDVLQADLVRRARFFQVSWKDIGAAMGMSAQGAHKKATEGGWLDRES